MTFITPSPFLGGGGIYKFHLRNKSYLESVHQVSPDFKDHQWLLKANPMDPSLPFLGRKHKFCLYNSYFLVQDSLWIQQPYEVFLHLPVSPYGPLYRLFYKGRSVNFQLKKYYTNALTGMETAAISSTLSMDYSNQSLAPCHSPFFQGELCLFWKLFQNI